LQWNLFDVSGLENLSLKEKYGAMELEGCDDQLCLEPVTLRYTIDNVGQSPMTVTSMGGTNNGVPFDCLGDVDPNPIPVGDSVTFDKPFVIDYCSVADVSLTATVDANPPNGDSCQDDDDVSFPIRPDCEVDLTLECTDTTTGTACEDLAPYENVECDCADEGDCTTGLTFLFTGDPCPPNPNGFECEGDFIPGNQALVQAVAGGLNFIFQGEVTIGDTITMQRFNDLCLLDTITVLITPVGGGSGTDLQRLTIDTRCQDADAGVRLSQSFGALQFIGYNCKDDPGLSCFSGVLYETCAINEGTVALEVAEFTLTVDGDTTPLLEGTTPVVLPGGEFCAETTVEIFRCTEETITANAVVGTNFTGCEDEEPLVFVVPPPPTERPTSAPTLIPSASPSAAPSASPSAAPTETCLLDLNLVPPPTPGPFTIPECEQRANLMGLVFTGGTCEQSEFCVENEVECANFPANGEVPAQNSREEAFIFAYGRRTDRPVFRGIVREGDVYFLYNDGDQLDADQTIEVYPANYIGSFPNPAAVLQSVTFHASCSQPLLCFNVFGAHRIVSFANEDQGNVSCLEFVPFEYTVRLPVSLPAGETEVIIEQAFLFTNYTNPQVVNVDSLIGQTLGPNNPDAEFSFEANIDPRISAGYFTRLTIVARTVVNNIRCLGVEVTEFSVPGDGTEPGVPTCPD
jgi:archaellin